MAWQLPLLIGVLGLATVAVVLGAPFLLVVVAALILLLVALLVLSSRVTGGGRVVGAFLSDERFVALATARSREVDVLLERPRADVDRAVVEVVESRWLIFTAVETRTRIGGPGGILLTIDQPGNDPSIMAAMMREAGLHVTVATTTGPGTVET